MAMLCTVSKITTLNNNEIKKIIVDDFVRERQSTKIATITTTQKLR